MVLPLNICAENYALATYDAPQLLRKLEKWLGIGFSAFDAVH